MSSKDENPKQENLHSRDRVERHVSMADDDAEWAKKMRGSSIVPARNKDDRS